MHSFFPVSASESARYTFLEMNPGPEKPWDPGGCILMDIVHWPAGVSQGPQDPWPLV